MKINQSYLDKIYITSDTHAYHKNITRGTSNWSLEETIFTLRDFDTPEEMTNRMIENFNSTIPKDAILFHLGDLSFAGEENIPRFINQLNVKQIHFLLGNHDHHIERGKYNKLFTTIHSYLELNIGEFNFCLFHFPIESWNGIRKGYYHLHGHQHLSNENKIGNGKKMDVGVDGNNLYPYKLTDVIDILKDRKFISETDHHA